MLLSATSEGLARLRVSDLTAAAPCGPSLFEHTGFCKQGGPVLDTSLARRLSGSWRMMAAGRNQRDRAAQKVFARAGSRKPRSDQHQECSTTDNLEGSVGSRDSKGRCRGAARDLIEAGLN